MRTPFRIGFAIVVVLLGQTGCLKASDPGYRNWQALTHWATRETNYNHVQIGMAKQTVLSLMGAPDRKYQLTGRDVEEWAYEFPDGEGHIVIDFDGKGAVIVKQFGYC